MTKSHMITVSLLEDRCLDECTDLFLCGGVGVLRALGEGFVREYLRWTIFGPPSLAALGAFTGDPRLVGFCVATRANSRDTFVARHLPFIAAYLARHPRVLVDSDVWRGVGAVLRLKLLSWIRPKRRTEQPQPAARLLAIIVDAAYRNRGIGRLLLEDCEKVLLAQGHRTWGLVVAPSNRAALALYEKLGWKKESPNGVWKGDMVKGIGSSCGRPSESHRT